MSIDPQKLICELNSTGYRTNSGLGNTIHLQALFDDTSIFF